MRLSRIVRTPDAPTNAEVVPLRRAILWGLVGVAVLVGMVLYFKYARLLSPLLD